MFQDDSAPAHDAAVAQALGAYLAEMLAHKRVAIFGDGTGALPERLADSSGRRVHVFDADARRVAEAIARSRGAPGRVRFALLEADSEIAAGAFDAVLIPNLAALGSSLAPQDALAIAERMLAPRGLCAVATPAAGAIGYYELYDLVSARFAELHMLGAVPFAGLAVAAFGAESEPELAIDSSLCERQAEPRAFIAVASRDRLRIEPYLLVQLPAAAQVPPAEGAQPAPPAESEALSAAMGRERHARELAQERGKTATLLSARVAELELALRQAREQRRRDRQEEEAEAERAREQGQREVDAVLERIAELEAELEPLRAAAPDQPKIEAPQTAVRGLEFQIAELRRLLGEARAECDALRDRAARAAQLETEVERCRRDLAQAQATAAPSAAPAAVDDDLARLEGQLLERGRRVNELDAELRESERIGRELVAELEQARQSHGANGAQASLAQLSEERDRLAARLARCEADLQSSAWRVEELERRIGEPPPGPDDLAKLEAALAAAHDEIARLQKDP